MPLVTELYIKIRNTQELETIRHSLNQFGLRPHDIRSLRSLFYFNVNSC